MHRNALRAATALFVSAILAILAGSGVAAPPAPAAGAMPTLFTIESGAPRVLASGAQKSWPVSVSEDNAMSAVFSGGMWLPTPTGGREYAKYVRHIVHANGIWTWVGSVDTVHGPQSVMLTFGEHSVYGVIPQAKGYPLRITTERGQTRLVETSAEAMRRSPIALRLRSRPDYLIPPAALRHPGQPTNSATIQSNAPARADASSAGSTIDVMVAYTKGFESSTGGSNSALARIQYLVDYTNQAYVNSKINAQIRLVHTVEVDYPDNTSNDSALDDLTGLDSSGNPITVPPSLQQIAPLRSQYGADLVAMVRAFDNSTQGGCGVGWLIGGNQQPINPQYDSAYGYSVTSDGTSGGYYCIDGTFAHELGHNMGSAHDRANASEAGAYPYSYGYVGNGDSGFATIMAYGTSAQTPMQVFSNPDISVCQNTPCGVADSSSSSADNAHSINNTASLIAQFETSKNPVNPDSVPGDVNGDGYSDILWRYSSSSSWAFGYWLLQGSSVIKTWSIPTTSTYRVAATGDFNGDGYLDIAWTSNKRDVKIWFGNGHSFSKSYYVRSFSPGWELIGSGDIDGDGKTDLLFRYTSGSRGKFGYWIMDGAKVVRTWSTSTTSKYRVGATGDFNGDGKLDIAWTSDQRDVKIWFGTGTSFSKSAYVATYANGWRMQGAGDIDGDGRDDLLFSYKAGSTARFGYWIQHGATRARTWSTSFDPAYSIATTGDFNGDGKLDIAWTSAARDIQIWTGNGTSFSGNTFVRNYSAGWAAVRGTP